MKLSELSEIIFLSQIELDDGEVLSLNLDHVKNQITIVVNSNRFGVCDLTVCPDDLKVPELVDAPYSPINKPTLTIVK